MLKEWTGDVKRCAAWTSVAVMLAGRGWKMVVRVRMEDWTLALPSWTVHRLNFELRPLAPLLSLYSLYVNFSESWPGHTLPPSRYVSFLSRAHWCTFLIVCPRLAHFSVFCFVWFCFPAPSSCLWHLCLAFLSSLDDSCHFHFCGECDIDYCGRVLFFITDFLKFVFLLLFVNRGQNDV